MVRRQDGIGAAGHHDRRQAAEIAARADLLDALQQLAMDRLLRAAQRLAGPWVRAGRQRAQT